MPQMLAFHAKKAVKDKYLNRLRAHAKADELIHGIYWENGKGCAVGCTIHSAMHASYETELGIPETLARLEDSIFEGMVNGDSKVWPIDFLSAIKVGADLSMVWPRFALWLMTDPQSPNVLGEDSDSIVAKAVAGVGALYREWVDTGERPGDERWAASADSAASAASAAWAASAASAASAARAASADSAARAASAASAAWAAWAASAARAASAASAAWAAWAASAARSDAWKRMRDILLDLLRSAPVAKKGVKT